MHKIQNRVPLTKGRSAERQRDPARQIDGAAEGHRGNRRKIVQTAQNPRFA